MNDKNAIIEGYLDMVKKKIRKFGDIDRFIDFLREDLQDYCDNNPDCTEEDLIREFGKPEDVAKEYINDNFKVDPKELAKKKKKNIIIIIILSAILMFAAVKAIRIVIAYIDIMGGYIVIETEIEEEVTDGNLTE